MKKMLIDQLVQRLQGGNELGKIAEQIKAKWLKQSRQSRKCMMNFQV